ncbi:MAG TPA: sulfatase [Candidatus Polarisedimenticolaceae bacterium]|nr:sulfatase [Candidatus Polarisedimenticolaceae bacterium]
MAREPSTGGATAGGRSLRSIRAALAWVGPILLVSSVAVAVLLAARILTYRQRDDPAHLASKRDYLAELRQRESGRADRPNLVVILFDDLGYGDLGAYGGRSIRTPRIDRLAAAGMRFANAYASPYCSASRAALLTGRYAVRSGLDHVLQDPGSLEDQLLKLGRLNRRLPAEEITLAEVLSAAGYATAIVGKWHLGGRSPSLPDDFGFDSFYGLLTSNDQGRPVVWADREVAEPHPIDQTTLTRRYTERAVRFIERNADRPFFLYMPHTFPHLPLHVAPDRLGRSPAGLYGDVVEELDDSVGAVVDALERTGVAGRTLVVISSDNGPWFQGSPGELRDRKMSVFEGGTRVPLIAYWPGQLPAAVVIEQSVGLIDLFPTMLELAGLPPPHDRLLDGRSLAPLFRGEPLPDRPVFFHQLAELRAVRSGCFKYHDRHGVYFGNPMDWPWAPMRKRGPWLFDLARDPGESYDVSASQRSVARELERLLETHRQELADNPRGWR